jgi:hypothetical protein
MVQYLRCEINKSELLLKHPDKKNQDGECVRVEDNESFFVGRVELFVEEQKIEQADEACIDNSE